jgi:uncharacterized membrane protein (DUF106 family)
MKNRRPLALVCALAGVVLVVCSRNPSAVGARYSKTFQSADAPTKAAWAVAMQAVTTNGYAMAILTLKQLSQQPSLTPEQAKAVAETVTAVSDQMYKASNKGDPNALRAIAELREATMKLRR